VRSSLFLPSLELEHFGTDRGRGVECCEMVAFDDDLCKRLRSKKVAKRIAVLQHAVEELLVQPCTDAVFSVLLEDGVGAEVAQVRELAFACIRSVYIRRGKVDQRWADVRTSILTEVASAEDARVLAAALFILTLLSDTELAAFFVSKDGMGALMEAITAPEVPLRAAAVGCVAHLLDRVWTFNTTCSTGFEMSMQVGSSTEARRMHEDLRDQLLDIYKAFALGVLGEAPGRTLGETLPDDTRIAGLYASALLMAVERFNAAEDGLGEWVRGLLGEGCLMRDTASSAERGWGLGQGAIASAAVGNVLRGVMGVPGGLPAHASPSAVSNYRRAMSAGLAPVMQVVAGTFLSGTGPMDLVARYRHVESCTGRALPLPTPAAAPGASGERGPLAALDVLFSNNYGHADGALQGLLGNVALMLLVDLRVSARRLCLSHAQLQDPEVAKKVTIDVGSFGARSAVWDPLAAKSGVAHAGGGSGGAGLAATSATELAEVVLKEVLGPSVVPYGCAEVGHTASSVARRIRCARLIVRLVQVI